MPCLVARNWPPNRVFGIGIPNTTVWMCSVFVSGIGNQFRWHPPPATNLPPSQFRGLGLCIDAVFPNRFPLTLVSSTRDARLARRRSASAAAQVCSAALSLSPTLSLSGHHPPPLAPFFPAPLPPGCPLPAAEP
jgi:hypothetical protein